MLQFPYQPVPIVGSPPPSLPTATTDHWRPFVPMSVIGPTGRSRYFNRALVDPGSDDTIFPIAIVRPLAVPLRPSTGHTLRWRGQVYQLRFGDVQLQMADDTTTYRWPATIAFSDAPIPYRLLGYAGCLQFFDATFRGADHTVELEPNRAYPGTTS
jgi:hypothetical protein